MVNTKALVLVCLLMLLVTGASAAKFVIKDKDASLSLAATPKHEVAFSVVVAENPDSYSASMSADDSSGASASQDSSVGGADYIFSATAAVGPEGDSAYTATETYEGSTNTNQEAHASQGNSASVSQDTTSVAVAGASVSNATDSDGNTASQCIAFLLGVNNVNLAADTGNSATASQSGLFVGLFAHTLGFAETTIGDASYTDALVGAGGMTFDNTATAAETTSASQDVGMAGAFGLANARSIDHEDNLASQSVGFVGGVLAADQSTNTDHSASASQSGTFAGLTGGTLGLAIAKEGDVSETDAGVFIGGMTFDDTATAQDTSTSASQDVLMAGLLGSAHAGSIDQNGNIAGQSAAFTAGVLGADQTADTQNSASASQEGGYIGLGGATADGFARSTDGDISITHAGVVSGILPAVMTFDNSAKAQDVNTTASQDVVLAGLLGSATAVSVDQSLNIASQSDAFTAGLLSADQTVDTLNSASASQEGGYIGLGGATANGFARSTDGDVSITHADVLTGGMTFDNTAKAQDVNTSASQDVVLAGLLGSATSVSVDQSLNIASQSDAFTAGVLSADQTVDTLDSANAAQTGDFVGLGVMTNGFALSQEGDVSHTNAWVFTGGMTFDDAAKAQDTNTTASQDVLLAGLLGSAHAGSIDQNGNITSQDAGFVAGVLNTDQTTDTLSSAHATQSGTMTAALGGTSGLALSGGEVSTTDAGMVIGSMTFDNNAVADGHTTAGQTVDIPFAVAAGTSAGSIQGTNITHEEAGIILGTLDVTQEANTTASAHATQSGTMTAALGGTSGLAFSGGEVSTTNAGLVIGSMTFDNNAIADGHTAAEQAVHVPFAVAANASAGSNDGKGNATFKGAGILIGSMDVSQQVNTTASASGVQSGTMTTLLGNTLGIATSGTEPEQSWTEADVVLGTMNFNDNATANGHTTAGQSVQVPFAVAANASAGSNDGMGNVTFKNAGILIGSMDVSQQVNTTASASGVQSGTINAALGNTWGEARSGLETSWTKAGVAVGVMTFEDNATADGHTTVGQAVQINGNILPVAVAGNVSTGSDDAHGNVTSEAAGLLGGSLDATQHSDTSASAHATQSGTINAALGTTWGNAKSNEENSWTNAAVLAGTLAFNNNAAAGTGYKTTANQVVNISGGFAGLPVAIAGNASAGSDDADGNITGQASTIIGGTLDVYQNTGTIGSAFTTQRGNMNAAIGTTWGNATSGNNENSWTNAAVLAGTMAFVNGAGAGSNTGADQIVNISGGFAGLPVAVAGNVSAGSNDANGNVTNQVASILGGTLDVHQGTGTHTIGSAATLQWGSMSAALGTTSGNAMSGNKESWTNADVIVGNMTFANGAAAGAPYVTIANQIVNISGGFAGIPVAVSGNTSAGSDDAQGNITGEGAGILGGTLNVSQVTYTGGSAYAVQSGDVNAGYGFTTGNALSGNEQSWTTADVLVGKIAFNNNAMADGHTTAGQAINVSGNILSFAGAANASAGSDDNRGNVTGQGAGILAGTMNVTQQTNTTGSAHAVQSGTMSALFGNTAGDAIYEANRSWTNAGVILGTMTFDNYATSDSRTEAGQDVQIDGIFDIPIVGAIAGAGSTEAGSTDGTNTARLGTEFILGSLENNQTTHTETGAGVSAHQEGTIPFAVYGRTWGEAIDVDSAESWTNGTVVVGTMTFDTDANAGFSTSAAQHIVMLGLSGIATSGSIDAEGMNSSEVGAEIVGSDLTMLPELNWSEIDLDDITTIISQVIGDVNAGYLDVTQQANTSGSTHASQNGTVIALTEGRTWSNASSGSEEWSRTAANVTTGIIILDSNSAAAGASTSASQDAFIFGLYGNSTAGSRDATMSTEVGAEISGGALDLESIGDLIEDPSNILDFIFDALSNGQIGSGSIDMQQQANTESSAHASQKGNVTAFADGRTWGEAKSGAINRSWTEAGVSAGVLPGTITVNSNSVTAGPKTYAAQNLEIAVPGATIFGSGGSGYARSGSVNEVNGNYAIVGAGFANSNYNFGTLKVDQTTETDSLPGYAKANQTAQAGSSYYFITWIPTSFVNTYWTKAEAGSNLGVNASIGTIGTPGGAGNANLRTETAGAVGGTTRSYVSEQKTRLTGSSATIAYANNTLGLHSSPTRTGSATNGYAWAEAVNWQINLP